MKKDVPRIINLIPKSYLGTLTLLTLEHKCNKLKQITKIGNRQFDLFLDFQG